MTAATILVVDDTEESRYATARILKRAGFAIREADGGRAALAAAADGVDLVLLDVRMPDLDGYEVAQRLKADPRTAALPVLIYTASASDTDSKVKGLAVADGYLTEPVEAAELVAIIEATLRRRRSDDVIFEQKKMEAIGRLAGGLAHDFNNLLTVIVGYARLSLEELDPDHAVAGHLEEIYTAGQECAQLTRQLLAFSRKQISRPVAIDLHALLGENAKALRRILGATIELDLALEAPAATIHVDPAQLEQVFLMIAMNAREAMPRGGKLAVRTEQVTLDENAARALRGVTAGPYVRLSLTDTGVGMNERTRSRVFEPFFTTKGMGRGTGLGLAAVLGMVQQNAGTVEVLSTPAEGTTFRIYLPARPHSPVSELTAAVQPAPAAAPRTVLVVEDEPVVRSFARSVLLNKGFLVHVAGDGVEALEVFREHRSEIDLVLTDVVMPKMDGLQLTDELHRIAPGLTVCLMSGHPSPGDAVPHAKLGDLPLLAKPFTHRQLLEYITTWLTPRAVQTGRN